MLRMTTDLALIHAPMERSQHAGERRVAVVLGSNAHIEELGNQIPSPTASGHRIEGHCNSPSPEDFHSAMFGGSRSIVGGVVEESYS